MLSSHSGQITCRALGFHVYSLHHIFTTGAEYNGIDALYYKPDQSSTVSTAHSGSQAQKQIWHMQCQLHDAVSLWCIRKRLYSAPRVPLPVISPLCSCCFLATVPEPAGQCRARAWPQPRNTGMGKSHQRLREAGIIFIYFAAFVCGTSSFIFMWFSQVTKAPSALLSVCTEQQGVVYTRKTGAAWSINTEVIHFKSGRRQAGSVPYHIKANVRFCLWQWLVPDASRRKGDTMEADKAISVHHWELITEDWPNPWTPRLALFPNYLLILITTLHIVDGRNLL